MKEIGTPASPAEIATLAQLKPGNVRRTVLRMAKDGLVHRCDYGKYELASATPSPREATQRASLSRADDSD